LNIQSPAAGLNDESCAGTTDESEMTRRHKTGARTKGKAKHAVLCLVIPSLPSLLLPPIDDDATRSHRRDTERTLGLAAQPFESTFVVLKKAFERLETLLVVPAQPVFLLLAEHVFQHHARLDRHAR
jgi:hypothetical protein